MDNTYPRLKVAQNSCHHQQHFSKHIFPHAHQKGYHLINGLTDARLVLIQVALCLTTYYVASIFEVQHESLDVSKESTR